MGPSPASPKLRADAERNRRRVLDAAREVLAERGLDFSLDEVARVAGVGIGTVYRRFPDRDALVTAVVEAFTDGLIVRVEAVHDDDPAVWLHGVAEAYAEEFAANLALFDIVRARPAEIGGLDTAKRRVQAAMRKPLRAAQAAGLVRHDLHPRDLTLLLSAVARIRPPGPGGATLWRRELAIVLDGLAPRTASVLPRMPG